LSQANFVPKDNAVGRKMSDKNLEQWINLKFCMKAGKSASETLALLTLAYDKCTMKKLSVFDWHRQFKDVLEYVLDDSRSGQPTNRKGRMQMWTE
jgi:hypothetical protein